MAWIESHQELGRHPKTRKLARTLGISIPTAIGHLHLFWWWALDYAQDGDITKFDLEEIADAALWDGDATTFYEALVTVGFIDQDDSITSIHDWEDYAGKIVDRRERNRQAMRTARERDKQERVQHVVDTSDTRDETCRPTVPNRTLQNHMDGNHITKSREIGSVAVATTRALPAKRVKTTADTPPPRAPNPVWNALTEALHTAPATRTECTNWGKVVKELTEAGATPEEVRVRTARYIKRYGRERLTINALHHHWSECALDIAMATGNQPGGNDEEARRILAEKRETDKQRLYAEAMQLANGKTPMGPIIPSNNLADG